MTENLATTKDFCSTLHRFNSHKKVFSPNYLINTQSHHNLQKFKYQIKSSSQGNAVSRFARKTSKQDMVTSKLPHHQILHKQNSKYSIYYTRKHI
jgi:hypothetical protein